MIKLLNRLFKLLEKSSKSDQWCCDGSGSANRYKGTFYTRWHICPMTKRFVKLHRWERDA